MAAVRVSMNLSGDTPQEEIPALLTGGLLQLHQEKVFQSELEMTKLLKGKILLHNSENLFLSKDRGKLLFILDQRNRAVQTLKDHNLKGFLPLDQRNFIDLLGTFLMDSQSQIPKIGFQGASSQIQRSKRKLNQTRQKSWPWRDF